MNLNELLKLEDQYKLKNCENFLNQDDLEKFINLVEQFDSYEKFYKFMEIMKSIPNILQISDLTITNSNLPIFEFLQSQNYFNLLSIEQKYMLFLKACLYNSLDIALLIFISSTNLLAIKEFMKKYLAQIGNNMEYLFFKKIWEKNIIVFNQEEIDEMFFFILKTSNLEFIEWFYSLNLINLKDEIIIKKIGFEILDNASNSDDFIVAIFICSLYLEHSI